MKHTSVNIKEFYAPGNIIYNTYWQSFDGEGYQYDLVISLNEYIYTDRETRSFKTWDVDVVECNAHGTPLPNAQKRNHQTWPDECDKIVGSIDVVTVVISP